MSSSGKIAVRSIQLQFDNAYGNQSGALPAGATELAPGGTHNRRRFNLSGYTQVRCCWSPGTAPANPGSTANLEFTTDLSGAGGWTTLSPTCAIDVTDGGLPVPSLSAFGAIPALAMADVLIRWVARGGNAAAIPQWSDLSAEFR